MAKRPFNGSPTVDGYYTTFDSSEVHRVDNSEYSGSGSGSSDFSIANVSLSGDMRFSVPCISSVYGGSADIAPSDPSSILVILYKGKAVLSPMTLDGVTVTGAAEIDEEADAIIITGDCSIIVNGSGGGLTPGPSPQ